MSTTQSSINPSPVRISEGEMGDEVGNKSESEVDELTSPADLNLFVEDLLEQMNSHFTEIGMSILGRMDEMGSRIDELEQSVVALMDHAGIDRDNINTSFASSSSQNSSLLPSLPRSSAGGSTTPDDMNTTTGGAGTSKLTPSNRTIHSIEI